jgi:ABC-type nitrate/sulfonate/bicarbonate transport system substrate-binding protein
LKKAGILGLVLIIILVGVILWYSVYFLPSNQRAEQLVIAGPFPFRLSYWDHLYAEHTGIFDEYNLNVSHIEVRSVSEMTQATLAGEIDLMYAVGDSIKPALAGAPFKIVLAIAKAPFCMIARPEINSVEDIKVHADAGGRGSDGETLARKYFSKNGMEENEDYTMIYISMDAIVPGFENQDFDSTSAGGISFTLRKMGGKQVVKFAEEFPQFYTGGFAGTESNIEQKREAIKNYMKAIYRSQSFLIEHKEEAIEFATDILGLELDYATFVYDFGYTNKYGAPFKVIPSMPIADIEYTMKLCAESNDLDEMPIEDLIDTTLWDQVKQELGI